VNRGGGGRCRCTRTGTPPTNKKEFNIWSHAETSVADPDPDPGSDHISKSLENFFGLKYLYCVCGSGIRELVDPGTGFRDGKKFGSGIQDKHPESATLT
jgi:hypothetical protein